MGGLETLYNLYHLKVFRTAYGILRNRASAEDATQEVFVKLSGVLARFDTGRPLAPWVHRLAVNACLDSLKRHRRGSVSLDDALEVQSPDPPLDDLVLDLERRETVWRAIGKLDPKQRAAVVLRYYHELNEAEMAIALRCRRGTVKSRLHYALEALHKILAGPPSFDDPAVDGAAIIADVRGSGLG